MYKIFFLAIALISGMFANAQSAAATATFKVDGVCEMCKERIENAAYIKGVKKAVWDKETKMLTVFYNPKKVTLQKIEESIAKAGHDTENVKASAEAYAKIHGCCEYREDDTH